MNSGPKTLVLGATGHVGQAIVRALIARGHPVTATTRRTRPPSLAHLAADIATGDADDPNQLDRWVAGHDWVVDAAAPHPLNVFVPDEPAERDPVPDARTRLAALWAAVMSGPRRVPLPGDRQCGTRGSYCQKSRVGAY